MAIAQTTGRWWLLVWTLLAFHPAWPGTLFAGVPAKGYSRKVSVSRSSFADDMRRSVRDFLGISDVLREQEKMRKDVELVKQEQEKMRNDVKGDIAKLRSLLGPILEVQLYNRVGSVLGDIFPQLQNVKIDFYKVGRQDNSFLSLCCRFFGAGFVLHPTCKPGCRGQFGHLAADGV